MTARSYVRKGTSRVPSPVPAAVAHGLTQVAPQFVRSTRLPSRIAAVVYVVP